MTNKEVLNDTFAPVLALLVVITKMYGTECYDWEPAVLRAELNKDLDMELTDLQNDRLQAAILVLTTNQYEVDVMAFETVTNLINGEHDTFEYVQPIEAEEIVSGLADVYLLRNEELDFSPAVRAYAGIVFFDYGFHQAPEVFPSAIPYRPSPGDDTEKNAALRELFQSRIDTVKEYVDKVTL